MNISHYTKVALFCGGRGSATIIHELLKWPNIHLTLIVNAYDDGLSTGALREFVTQMLGLLISARIYPIYLILFLKVNTL